MSNANTSECARSEPTIPSRQAFLMVSSAFVIGSGVGITGGHAVATMRAGSTSPRDGSASTEDESRDALLDELRQLATVAPIDELVTRRLDFLNHLYSTYPSDEIAWRGVGRLAEATLSNEEIPDRKIFARWLAQIIEKADRSVTREFLHLAPELRRIQR